MSHCEQIWVHGQSRPQDVLTTLLNNLKVQERQNYVCTTVAIAIVAETCSPFTVLLALMNEYHVPELNARNGVPKSVLPVRVHQRDGERLHLCSDSTSRGCRDGQGLSPQADCSLGSETHGSQMQD